MNQPALPANLTRLHRLLMACYYGLLAYFALVSVLALEDLRAATMVIFLIQTVPLLIFLPGLRRRHLRTHAWLSFVVLLYFIHAVLIAFNPASRWLGIVEVLLSVGLFTTLVLYIRGYRNHFKVNF